METEEAAAPRAHAISLGAVEDDSADGWVGASSAEASADASAAAPPEPPQPQPAHTHSSPAESAPEPEPEPEPRLELAAMGTTGVPVGGAGGGLSDVPGGGSAGAGFLAESDDAEEIGSGAAPAGSPSRSPLLQEGQSSEPAAQQAVLRSASELAGDSGGDPADSPPAAEQEEQEAQDGGGDTAREPPGAPPVPPPEMATDSGVRVDAANGGSGGASEAGRAPSSRVVRVEVPLLAVPGSRLEVQLPDGVSVSLLVPEGALPGSEIEAVLPAEPETATPIRTRRGRRGRAGRAAVDPSRPPPPAQDGADLLREQRRRRAEEATAIERAAENVSGRMPNGRRLQMGMAMTVIGVICIFTFEGLRTSPAPAQADGHSCNTTTWLHAMNRYDRQPVPCGDCKVLVRDVSSVSCNQYCALVNRNKTNSWNLAPTMDDDPELTCLTPDVKKAQQKQICECGARQECFTNKTARVAEWEAWLRADEAGWRGWSQFDKCNPTHRQYTTNCTPAEPMAGTVQLDCTESAGRLQCIGSVPVAHTRGNLYGDNLPPGQYYKNPVIVLGMLPTVATGLPARCQRMVPRIGSRSFRSDIQGRPLYLASFTVVLDGEDCDQGSTPNHGAVGTSSDEVYIPVHYLVAESGYAGGIQVSTLRTKLSAWVPSSGSNGSSGDGVAIGDWQAQSFSAAVRQAIQQSDHPPVVLSQTQSGHRDYYNMVPHNPNPDFAAMTRLRSVSAAGFQVRLERVNTGGFHEVFGYALPVATQPMGANHDHQGAPVVYRPSADQPANQRPECLVGWIAMPRGRHTFGALTYEAKSLVLLPAVKTEVRFSGPMLNVGLFATLDFPLTPGAWTADSLAWRLQHTVKQHMDDPQWTNEAHSSVEIMTVPSDSCGEAQYTDRTNKASQHASVLAVTQNVETYCPAKSTPTAAGQQPGFVPLIIGFCVCFVAMPLMLGPAEFSKATLACPMMFSRGAEHGYVNYPAQIRIFMRQDKAYSLGLLRAIIICWILVWLPVATGTVHRLSGAIGNVWEFCVDTVAILHMVFSFAYLRNCFIAWLTDSARDHRLREENGPAVPPAAPGVAQRTDNPLVPESADVEAPPNDPANPAGAARAPAPPSSTSPPPAKKGPSLLRCGKCAEIFGLPADTPPDAAARCPHCKTVNRQPPTFADKNGRLQRRLKHMRLTLQRQRRHRNVPKLRLKCAANLS
jgi:phage FluMu protein Com